MWGPASGYNSGVKKRNDIARQARGHVEHPFVLDETDELDF
jgi:hypothetical protein